MGIDRDKILNTLEECYSSDLINTPSNPARFELKPIPSIKANNIGRSSGE